MKIVVVSYLPVRLYPPSLSAINNLSKIAAEVIIITRNTTNFEWVYPDNVREILVGDFIDIKQSERQSIYWKVAQFYKYINAVKQHILLVKPDVVLMYDYLSAYAYHVNRRKFKKNKHTVWYHNHDVVEKNSLRRFSIGWFAEKSEHKIFKYLNIFTLPSAEREKYFPLTSFKGKCLVIPNYPSKTIYPAKLPGKKLNDVIKLVFAGSISAGHGLEEIIGILSKKINGKSLELHLLGPAGEAYLSTLLSLAKSNGVTSKVIYHGWQNFKDIPVLLREYHIGLAINKPVGIIYSTGGTASNKIYEYAAMGFPTLLYDNEHYRKYLQAYPWAFFTDCTSGSLILELEKITTSYEHLSIQANRDFTEKLNFEAAFHYVSDMLIRNDQIKTNG